MHRKRRNLSNFPEISRAAYLEGFERAGNLSAGEFNLGTVLGSLAPMLTPLLGLIPGAGPIIQGIAGPLLNAAAGGAGAAAGGAAGAAANPFAALLGGGAGSPLTGLLSQLTGAAVGGAGLDGKGGTDAATALLAAQLARNPQTDPSAKPVLDQLAEKGRQEAQSRAVQDAVSPELQAIKGQVDALQREQRERQAVARSVREDRFQQLTLDKLNLILDQAGVSGGARRY